MDQAGQVYEDTFSAGKYIYERRTPPGPGIKDYIIFTVLLLATAYSTWYVGGFAFSLSLLLILGAHEFGHYWAARRNQVATSLPWFIPAPPIFIAGTMGAFIRIKEPIPDRPALMEIGAWGPIAGFIVAVPVMVIGLLMSNVSQASGVGELSFGSSIIMVGLSKLILGVTPYTPDVNIELHMVAFAGWLGLFFTALNLWPVGQLDGGHIIYSLWPRHHSILAKIFFASLILLGFWWHGWWVWGLLILFIGFRHPPLPFESIALTRGHKITGYVSIFIFAVTFIPIPMEIFV